MVAVALYATDPAARRRLEGLAAEQDGVTIIGTANSPAALARLLAETRAEAVLAEAQPVLAALLAADPSQETAPASDEAETVLTPREIEVLAAMADGASNKMIARRLGISFHTVKFHVASILAKLDADSRTEAVAQGARLGLVML